jgi:hypothetical protein
LAGFKVATEGIGHGNGDKCAPIVLETHPNGVVLELSLAHDKAGVINAPGSCGIRARIINEAEAPTTQPEAMGRAQDCFGIDSGHLPVAYAGVVAVYISTTYVGYIVRLEYLTYS